MTIQSLILSSFRRFAKETFSFSPNTTIVVGPNASGKTSLLEAIYLLALGKSFRASKDSESISFEKEMTRVNGVVELSGDLPAGPLREASKAGQAIKPESYEAEKPSGKIEQKKLEIIITQGEVAKIKTPLKKFLINGVSKRMVDFAANLRVVLFWPQDLELVTDSPSLRRHYLNYVLSQTDREYRRTIASYDRGLRQRNRLLEAVRDGNAHSRQLLFWDQLLIKQGEYISKKREEYITFINNYQSQPKADRPLVETIYQLVYDASEISRQRLDQYAQAEVAAGMTLVGPHRDDIKFQITYNIKHKTVDEWISLSEFGSRGEQRLAVLWLKLAELSYMEKTTGDKPVLLLDDILSELDHPHRHEIFSIIGQQQTILTLTDKHFIEKDLLKNVEVIEL